MKRVLILPVFAILFTMLMLFPHNASASPHMSVAVSGGIDPGTIVTISGSGFSSSDTVITIKDGMDAHFIATPDSTPCLVTNGAFSCNYFAFPSGGGDATANLEAVGDTGDFASDFSFIYGFHQGIATYPSKASVGTTVTVYGSGYLGDLVIKGVPIGDQDLKVFFNNGLVAEGIEPSFHLVTPGSTTACYPTDGSLDDNGPCTFSVPILDPGTYTIDAIAYSFGIVDKDFTTSFTIVAPSISTSTIEPTAGSTITLTGVNFSGIDTSGKVYWRGANITPSSGCPFTSLPSGASFSCSIQVPLSGLASPGPNAITVVGNKFGDSASTSVDIQGPFPLSVSSSQVIVGSAITVSGVSFPPSDTFVTLNIGSQNGGPGPTCPLTSGAFSCSFTIPLNSQVTGNTEIFATGNNGGIDDFDFASLDILSGIALSTSSGPVGTTINISGNGFLKNGIPDDSVTATFDGQNIPITVTATDDIINTVNGKPVYYTFTGPCPTQNGDGSLPAPSYLCSITVPTFAVTGSNTLTLTGNGGDSASTTFTLTPSMVLSQTQGSPGSSIGITGYGFPSYSYIGLEFNGNLVNSPQNCNDSSGTFSCSFTVPDLGPGSYTLQSLGSFLPPLTFFTGQFVTSASFTIVPSLSLGSSEGVQGSSIHIQADSFSTGDTGITLFLNSISITPTCSSSSSGSSNSFSCLFTVPSVSPNNYVIRAVGNHDGDSATANFLVSGITTSPTSETSAELISVQGIGFSPTDTSATLTLNGQTVGLPNNFNGQPQTPFGCSVSNGKLVASLITGGGYPCSFIVPENVQGGPDVLTATGNSGDAFTTTFTTLPSIHVAQSGSGSAPGTSVTVFGGQFLPSDTSVSLLALNSNNNTPIGSPTDCPVSGGSITCPFTIPNVPSGTYVLSASGISDDQTESPFIVTAPPVTPPVIAPISDQTIEATSSAGAVATFTATATDSVDGTDPVTCNPASGSTFAIGSTTVTCNSQDAAGNMAIPVTFTVTVQDTTPPVLTLPSDITQEATGPSGNVVTYTASANDLVDGSVTPLCNPSSGSTFPVGTDTVTCTATDAHHNTTSGTFHVIIQDTTPPTITVTDINAKATGPLTPVTFSPTATDSVDGTDPVTCNMASGSTFPLGTTTVNCSSTDAHHNTTSASFTVTVAEITAPSITLPDDIVQEATGPAGNTVTFTATATDIVDGTDPVTCNMASGSTFPLGTTTVTCTSTNHAGNTATGTLHVTIQDTTQPTLTIQSPANNAIVNTATVLVSGTASDNVHVASVTWNVDNGPVSTALGTTSWSFTTGTLSTGLHTIHVNATDEVGLVAKSPISITYVAPTDTLPAPSGGTTPITFSSSSGGFTSLNSISQSSLSTPPPPGNYPLGFFSWDITGFAPSTSVTITITSPVALHHQSHYFKLVGGNWVSIPVSVLGNTMTFTISDNGPFDGNPAIGVISDPGAVANPTDGRVNGNGNIGKNIDFSFEVLSDIDKTGITHGTLDFNDKSGNIKLHNNRVSFLSVDPTVSQATFSGTGDLGNKHNYIFIVSIADPDKTGDHDTFSITITDSTGKVVYTDSGTVKGHIEIHKFADKDDKSDSGVKHGNNGNQNGNDKGNSNSH